MVLGPFAETKGPRLPGRNPAIIISLNNCGSYMGNHKMPIPTTRIPLYMTHLCKAWLPMSYPCSIAFIPLSKTFSEIYASISIVESFYPPAKLL